MLPNLSFVQTSNRFDVALSSTIYQVVKLYKLDILHAHYYSLCMNVLLFPIKQMLKENADIPLVTTPSRNRHHFGLVNIQSYKHVVELAINQAMIKSLRFSKV